MKPIHAGLVSLMIIGAAGAATAQTSVYTDPRECVAQVGGLNLNGDGFVDPTEMGARGHIKSTVDTNGDGRISKEEITMACDSKTIGDLKPKN